MGWKRWVRHGVDVMAAATGELERMRRAAAAGVTALMYHRVLPDAECASYPLANLVVSRSCFARQVEWLARHARVVVAREAVDRLAAGPSDRPVVCLTFDDGYADNAEVAAPLLEEHGLRATFFVTTDFVEGQLQMWFDRAALHWERSREDCRDIVRSRAAGAREPTSLDGWLTYLKCADPALRSEMLDSLDRAHDVSAEMSRCRAMTVAQVKGLHERGHEIGNHTRTHPWLPSVSDTGLVDEIDGARRRIEEWTGADVPGFCYPAGDHSDASVAAVRRAGHGYAFTTRAGINGGDADPLLLRRRFVHPSGSTGPRGGVSVLSFRAEIFGLHDRMRRRA